MNEGCLSFQIDLSRYRFARLTPLRLDRELLLLSYRHQMLEVDWKAPVDAVRPVCPWPINLPVGIPDFFQPFRELKSHPPCVAEELVS